MSYRVVKNQLGEYGVVDANNQLCIIKISDERGPNDYYSRARFGNWTTETNAATGGGD